MTEIEDYEKRKNKRFSSMKSIADYTIGAFITALGIFFLIRGLLSLKFNERFPPDILDKVFGIVCVLYGAWRIYRGYKKNYFK